MTKELINLYEGIELPTAQDSIQKIMLSGRIKVYNLPFSKHEEYWLNLLENQSLD